MKYNIVPSVQVPSDDGAKGRSPTGLQAEAIKVGIRQRWSADGPLSQTP
jgi:hypothetical protein